MNKTTIYLPDDLKAALEAVAVEDNLSEAEVIREALWRVVRRRQRPRPKIPIISKGLGDKAVAEHVDQLLEGFGRR